MKNSAIDALQLSDTAADSVIPNLAEEAALESHLQALQERRAEVDSGSRARDKAELDLQIARTLVELARGAEAWAVGRRAFNVFIDTEDSQSLSEFTECAIHAGNLAVEMLKILLLVCIYRAVFFNRLMRPVWGAEPDYSQKWPRVFGMFFNKFKGCIHSNH